VPQPRSSRRRGSSGRRRGTVEAPQQHSEHPQSGPGERTLVGRAGDSRRCRPLPRPRCGLWRCRRADARALARRSSRDAGGGDSAGQCVPPGDVGPTADPARAGVAFRERRQIDSRSPARITLRSASVSSVSASVRRARVCDAGDGASAHPRDPDMPEPSLRPYRERLLHPKFRRRGGALNRSALPSFCE
jgi:hypothetical protein